jgi:hypothetical protein
MELVFFWDEDPPNEKDLQQEALNRLLNKREENAPRCSCKDMEDGCIC